MNFSVLNKICPYFVLRVANFCTFLFLNGKTMIQLLTVFLCKMHTVQFLWNIKAREREREKKEKRKTKILTGHNLTAKQELIN